jgi:hypothetical protein
MGNVRIGGNNVSNSNGQPGIYGTLGASAATNIPGRRDSAAIWTDSSGDLWLFGIDFDFSPWS